MQFRNLSDNTIIWCHQTGLTQQGPEQSNSIEGTSKPLKLKLVLSFIVLSTFYCTQCSKVFILAVFLFYTIILNKVLYKFFLALRQAGEAERTW